MDASTLRTKKLKKNVVISFLLKGITMANGFILVPLYLAYLDKESYGIWLTIASMLTWVNFFEIGLGNGLKNKLSEALAKNDFILGRQLVSSAYFYLGAIILSCLIIFIIVNPYINWMLVFKSSTVSTDSLSLLTLIVFSAFFLNVFLRLIISTLHAVQEVGMGDSINVTCNLLVLFCVFILSRIDATGNLLYIAIIAAWLPVLVYLIATIIFFWKKSILRKISPNYQYISKSHFKTLISLGFKFFTISISTLVLFQSSNILIIQFFDPEQVVIYNIAYKYFSVVNLLLATIRMPFWPAINEAWVKGDIKWVKYKVNQLIKIWVLLFLFSLLQLFLAKWIIPIWTNSDIILPLDLSLLLVLYFSIFSLGGIFNLLINALGKLKLQMICLLIGALLFIPLNYLFIKYFHLGLSGLVIAIIVANFYSPIIIPIQYLKIINNKAKGIWNA